MKHPGVGQRGLALLVALLVTALVAVIVVEFTYSTEVESHLVRNGLNGLQARLLARSGVTLGELALALDAAQKSKRPPERVPVETLSDPWAQPFPPMPVGQGFGAAGFAIVDESGRFNLNALARQDALAVMRQQLFQGLLEFLGLDPNLLYPLLDWLDPGDDSDRESGAESPYYLGLRPPYVPRNGKLLAVEELNLVKGFGELSWEQWTTLRSVITVLPDDELRINVNTAPEPLLKGLFAALDLASVADSLIALREEKPLQEADLSEFFRAYVPQTQVRSIFRVRSDTFTIYGTGTAAGAEARIAATERLSREQFPARLSVIAWREGAAAPVFLTSPGPSDGMTEELP
jgi:general secretion pathway protein K